MTAVGVGGVRWETGPGVLLRVAFALRVHDSRFGACRRVRPGDPPADVTLPPRAAPTPTWVARRTCSPTPR
ncbi:MAG: hypothetical protein ACRDTA_11785 [Pseudonocardiaceae bacterium]